MAFNIASCRVLQKHLEASSFRSLSIQWPIWIGLPPSALGNTAARQLLRYVAMALIETCGLAYLAPKWEHEAG